MIGYTHYSPEACSRRARPSDLHHTYAFPSGHTTAATFIVGALLFVALPLCAPALAEEVGPDGAASAAGSWCSGTTGPAQRSQCMCLLLPLRPPQPGLAELQGCALLAVHLRAAAALFGC